jgi:hypothetical protein
MALEGVAHEALHELERGGLLRVEFGGVTILDVDGLRGYSGTSEPRAAGEARVLAHG